MFSFRFSEFLVSERREKNLRPTDGMDLDGEGDGERLWTRVVHGSSQAPIWSSYKISEAEIGQFQQSFSKILIMLGSLLNDSRQKWEGVAVIFHSLG